MTPSLPGPPQPAVGPAHSLKPGAASGFHQVHYPRRAQPVRKPRSTDFRLLPLPFVLKPACTGGKSRQSHRRYKRQLAIWKQVNKSINCLNHMSGAPDEAISRANSCPPNPAQQSCLTHIASWFKDWEEPQFCGREAARLLLGNHLDYVGDGTSVEDYDPSRVSLPDCQLSPVPVADILHSDTAHSLELQGILADDDVIKHKLLNVPDKPYHDTALSKSKSLRLEFFKHLFACGILGFTRNAKEFVSPFFVKKKKNRQRLVWDCRRSNAHFARPPKPDMGAAESLQHLVANMLYAYTHMASTYMVKTKHLAKYIHEAIPYMCSQIKQHTKLRPAHLQRHRAALGALHNRSYAYPKKNRSGQNSCLIYPKDIGIWLG